MIYATPEYAKLQEEFHVARADYGTSGVRYGDHIRQLADKLNTRDLLDYGCGKATLQKSLPYPIQNYDPFIPEYNITPKPATLVICTDVMEHIEPQFISPVLLEIHSLTLKLAMFQIATGPAAKTLPDGRNAHLIQQGINAWLRALLPVFNIHHIEDLGTGFIAICSPIPAAEPLVAQRGPNPGVGALTPE